MKLFENQRADLMLTKERIYAILHSNKFFLKDRLLLVNRNFLISLGIIMLIGLGLMLSVEEGFVRGFFVKQFVFFLAGSLIFTLIAMTNIKVIFKLSYLICGACVGLTLLATFVGKTNMGATRWLDLGIIKFQPSEFLKLGLILCLSRYYYTLPTKQSIRLLYSILPIAIAIISAGLVIIQPDLGTGVIILGVSGCIIFLSGLHWRYFAGVAIAIIVALPLIWTNLYDYQKKRVQIFLNPQIDPFGSGYHIIQSTVAVGSGGIFGKGFLQGSQVQLDFLPEKHTDFVFTNLAEEFGLVGCLVLITCMTFVVSYGYWIAFNSENHYTRLVAVGIAFWYFLHCFVNIGMTIGLLPVVGIPLPLVSYGGSISVNTLTALGILASMDINKKLTSI